jgi:uncharacterized protein YqjF (DUF2071 family)
MILKRRQIQMEDRLRARERPQSKSILRMRWEQLLFLHWEWDAQEIQKTLPPGLFVDTFDGKGWLAIVPFFMKRVHPRGLPCLPWLSDFLELNVRTYVYDETGLPGVWFYSLVCNQPIAVELARRCFHLNYVHASMEARVDRNSICSYSARRRASDEATFRYGASGAKATAKPDSLEFFLVERYVLFAAGRKRRLYAGRVHHVPYKVGPALVEKWSFIPAMADGFEGPGRSADHMMVAEDIEVDAWPIRAHLTVS